MEFPPTTTALGRLRLIDVWDYSDGPRLFVARNASGALFIGIWADETEDADTWLYVPVSEQRLQLIESGKVSLRSAFMTAEDGYLFEIAFSNWRPKPIQRSE